MKYIKMTLDYIKSNRIALFLHAIIPAILFAVFISPTSIIEYVIRKPEYYEGNSFIDILRAMFDLSQRLGMSVLQIIGIVLSIIIIAIILSSLVGNIENKMLYGQTVYPGFKGVIKRININFLSVLSCMFTFTLALFTIYIVLSLLFFIFAHIHIRWLYLLLSFVFGIVCFGIFVVGLTFTILAIPNMTIRGFGISNASKKSSYTVVNNYWKVFASIVLPMIVIYIPVVLVAIFDYPGKLAVNIVVRFFFYLAAIMYYVPLFYVEFFDLEEMDRVDLKKNKYWEEL